MILDYCSQVYVLVKSMTEDAGPGVKIKQAQSFLKGEQSTLRVRLSEIPKPKKG
jgi:hypothetical protein